ncbi:methyl-accepting chemotaxis protein [Vibrio cholerae]|nr:methyl-accepting chemotaxis protein [Vibrio cholerae]
MRFLQQIHEQETMKQKETVSAICDWIDEYRDLNGLVADHIENVNSDAQKDCPERKPKRSSLR